MKIKIIHSLLAISCLFGAVSAWSQETYEPLHGVTGYGNQMSFYLNINSTSRSNGDMYGRYVIPPFFYLELICLRFVKKNAYLNNIIKIKSL